METYTHASQRAFVELFSEPSVAATPHEAGTSDADVARSEENILQWMSYLPENCIRTMIDMGWDVTT